MSSNIRKGSHTVSRLTCHIVWSTKYRYSVLQGDLQSRCRELLIQGCESQGIEILRGVVSSDHVHIHIEYAPKLSVSGIVKILKGRSSRKLQQEFPSLKKRYWGKHFWASDYGVWSSGNITDKMVNNYLEHHRRKDSNDNSNFILE
jgi:putative transposase